MTTAEFVSLLAERTAFNKTAVDAVLKSIAGAVHDALKQGGEIRIHGLGAFRVLNRRAKGGWNPKARVKMTILPTKVAVFRPARALWVAVKDVEIRTEKKK